MTNSDVTDDSETNVSRHSESARSMIVDSLMADDEIISRVQNALSQQIASLELLLEKVQNERNTDVERTALIKAKEMKVLARSLILPRIMKLLCMYLGKSLSSRNLSQCCDLLGYKNVDAVLYHNERGELPQSFIVQAITTGMEGQISSAYVARYLELFEFIRMANRTSCITGPNNSLAVSMTPLFFACVDDGLMGHREFTSRELRRMYSTSRK